MADVQKLLAGTARAKRSQKIIERSEGDSAWAVETIRAAATSKKEAKPKAKTITESKSQSRSKPRDEADSTASIPQSLSASAAVIQFAELEATHAEKDAHSYDEQSTDHLKERASGLLEIYNRIGSELLGKYLLMQRLREPDTGIICLGQPALATLFGIKEAAAREMMDRLCQHGCLELVSEWDRKTKRPRVYRVIRPWRESATRLSRAAGEGSSITALQGTSSHGFFDDE